MSCHKARLKFHIFDTTGIFAHRVFFRQSKTCHSTATTLICLSGAYKTGIYPFNADIVTSSPFVRELTQEEQQSLMIQRNANRLSIRNRLITDANCIVEISNHVGQNPRFAHLCLIQRYSNMTYSNITRALISVHMNDCKLLSPLIPFYR